MKNYYIKIKPISVSFLSLGLTLLISALVLLLGAADTFAAKSIDTKAIQKSPLEKVEQALEAGTITKTQQTLLELMYIFDNENFPSDLRLSTGPTTPLKCGFGVSRESHDLFPDLGADDQSLVTSILARPSKQVSYTPPGGHFLLHYDTVGVEAVPTADADSNGVPDFIEMAGVYLDSSWDKYHVTVGYLEPPSDGVLGGDSKYDVYFLAIAAFGVTNFGSAGPEAWNDVTSYIFLHNTFLGFPANQDPDGDQLGALKVTCAHEYYHAVQLAYDKGDSLWLYESGATSQEDALFPETHDNYQYFPFFWNDLDTFLVVNPGFHKYGAYVWPSFLSASHSESMMKTFWEYARFWDNMTSFDSALAQYGTTTKDEFQQFAHWNFLTGARFQSGFYADGADYPGVTLAQTLPQIPFSSVAPILPPDGLGSNYLALITQGGPPGMLVLEFSGDNSVLWRMNVYLKDTLGGYETLLLAPVTGLPNSDMTFRRYNYDTWDTIFVSPLVVSPFQSNNNYSLTASVLPHGDADATGTVNVADVTYLIAYIFAQGPEPVYELLLGDADCSGRVNVADVTLLIAHIFSGGPAPCSP